MVESSYTEMDARGTPVFEDLVITAAGSSGTNTPEAREIFDLYTSLAGEYRGSKRVPSVTRQVCLLPQDTETNLACCPSNDSGD